MFSIFIILLACCLGMLAGFFIRPANVRLFAGYQKRGKGKGKGIGIGMQAQTISQIQICMAILCLSLATSSYPLWNFGQWHFAFWDVGWTHLLAMVAIAMSLLLLFHRLRPISK